MTISKQEQAENIDEALRALLHIIEDQKVEDVTFLKDDSRVPSLFTTTWEYLEVNSFLRPIGMYYSPTPTCWVKALDVAGELRSPGTMEKLGALCASIKKICEASGTRQRARTTVEELSRLTDFSVGWISNVISGHLIELCLNQVECEWEPDDNNMNYVMIPARFGTKL